MLTRWPDTTTGVDNGRSASGLRFGIDDPV
jgi:hypothetical protein